MDHSGLAKSLLLMREHGVSPVKGAERSWRRLILRLAILGAGLYLYVQMPGNQLVVLAIGAVLGAMVQDIEWLWKIARSWPLTEEITNWDRVEEIAREQ